MAGAAAVPLDGLFSGVGVSASDLFGVGSVARRVAAGASKRKEQRKKDERNPRCGLRPALRFAEPRGEEPEPQEQKDEAKRNPHEQPRESLVLERIETDRRG